MKIYLDLSRQESYLAKVTLKNIKFEEFIKEIIKYADIIEKHNLKISKYGGQIIE